MATTAHQSGYLADCDWEAGSANKPGWLNQSVQLTVTSWSLTYNLRQFETPVQGSGLRTDPYVALTDGLNDWTVTIRFFVPSNMAQGEAAVGDAVTIRLYLNAADYYDGVGKVVRYEMNSPRDGPVTGVATIRCDGTLTHTAA